MKKSELRQIIKEEIKEVMDAFGSLGAVDWGDPVASRQRRGEVKVGDILTMVDKNSPVYGQKGKVIRIYDSKEGVEVDFGSGNKYGIINRRIKGNKINESQDLVSRIGDLEDILWNGSNRRAEKEWEIVSGGYLPGEQGAEHWDDLDDYDLRSAIDDAEHVMKKYKMGESVNEAQKFKNKEEVVDALVKDFGKDRKSYYNTPTNSNNEKYWTYNRTVKFYYDLVKKKGYGKSFDNMFKGTTPSDIDF